MLAVLHRPLIAALNHVLERENWAREKLRPHSGKTVEVRPGAAPAVRLRIAASGQFESAPDGQTDLRIGIPLAALVRPRNEALRRLALDGDMDFAQALDELARNLRPDVEEELSRFVGDIAAHRVAQGARDLRKWAQDAALRLGQGAAQYLQEERGDLPHAGQVRRCVAEVATLRDDVARFEARLRRAGA